MKVFLSHSFRDKDFVQKLAAAMTANGFTPWRCEVDIEISANFVAEISRGLKESDLTLLVWSPDAANSVWTAAEWTTVLKQQVEQSRICLGLIMLRQHELPPLLDTQNFIDARSDQDAGIRKALEWLELRRKAQRFSGLNAPIYLPYRPEDFVGRSVYLDQFRTALTWQPRTFLLHGEPGTGKSTLALQFAWDAQKDFDAVIFQTCGRRPLDAITAELVGHLPIKQEVKTLAPDQQREAAKRWLRQRRSLLVLDDVWPNGDGKIDIRELEPGPACSVLYTSRRQSLPGLAPKQLSKVEKFTEAEAEELFHTYLDPIFSKDEVDKNRQPLLDFAARVEMLPIAVTVGASLPRENTAVPLGKAVSKLKLSALNDGAKNVNLLFAQAIESQLPREQKLLVACAVCVQEGFWLPLAARIAELSEDEAEDAASALVRGSLLRVLDRDRRRFQIHALLRDQLRERAGNDGLADLQERHAAALEELFKDWETRWKDCYECMAEIIPAAKFLWNGEGDRDWQLSLRGYALSLRIGELDVALRIMQQEEELATNRGDHNLLQAIYGNQALILKAWGRLDDALALHKKEEAICLELGNKNSLQISYGNQALILYAWGRLEEAQALHKKQETICLELGNKDGLQRSYGNQANIYHAWGRLEEALALQKKQEAICLELGNKNSLQISYGNQALILKDWGRLEEALALLNKVEAICIELGNRDNLQRSYGNQALILIKQGQLTEALTLLQKSETTCKELGLKTDLGYRYWQWADLDAALGDRAAQLQKLQQALGLVTELNMPRQRDAVQAALDQLNSAD